MSEIDLDLINELIGTGPEVEKYTNQWSEILEEYEKNNKDERERSVENGRKIYEPVVGNI